jgi:hypothetical protein
MLERLKPYWLHAYLLTYTPLLLLADSHVTSLWQQYGLGLLTFAVLLLCSRLIASGLRRQVWLCVGVATGFEVLGSLIWGVYRYRFHNIPLYVPPGHGLVYLFGLTAVGTPLLQHRAREVAWVAFGLAGAWAAAGLAVLPALTGRTDVAGAMLLPILGWFLLRGPRGSLFAAIFLATTELELFGTAFGTWAWVAVQPVSHVAQGNPPSAIAGGYCVIDGSVLLLVLGLDRLRGLAGRRRRGAAAPSPGFAGYSPDFAGESLPP